MSTNTPLNILQLNPVRGLGSGGPIQAYQLAVGLVKRGHKVIYACREGKETIPESPGLQIIYLPMRNEWDIASLRSISRIIQEHQINVIHVHKGLAHSLAYPPARWHKVPAFFVNRGVTFPLDIFSRQKFHFKGVSRVIAVSEDVKQVLLKSGRLPEDKVTVVHGGTDMEFFDWRTDPAPVRREFNLDGSLVAGMVANVREWKGHRYLLEAVKELLPRFPRLTVLLAGSDDNSLGAELKQQCRDMGIGKRVIFAGFRRDVPQLMAAMDFTVIASYAGEGLTGAVRESLAMKKPVVGTDAGGMRTLVKDGITGFLVPPKDPAALASAMAKLLNQADLRRQMGEAGHRLIVEEFSAQARIERLERLYYEAVNESRG